MPQKDFRTMERSFEQYDIYRFTARGEKTVGFSVIGENRETGEERSRDRTHSIAPHTYAEPRVCENDI